MVSYESLGDLMDGRRWWIADVRGIGRSQFVFHNASDRNWWIGTFDGGAQAFTWDVAGHSSGFGDLQAGHLFWTGRFSREDRDQILFYYPGDQNWWLGTYDDHVGRLDWVSAGNSGDSRNLLDGHQFWTGRFSRGDRDQVLCYYPGDHNWWLGTIEPGSLVLTWSRVSIRPSGERVWIGRFAQSDRDAILVFDDPTFRVGAFDTASAALQWTDAGVADEPLSTRMVWIGRFSRSDRSEMLTFDPVDKLWRLATWDAAGTLQWSQAGRTRGFGDLLAGHRFWIGAFSRTGRDDVIFHYPGDSRWWRGLYGTTNRLQWKEIAGTESFGAVGAVVPGNFSRSDRRELLVQDGDRHLWWLANIPEDWDGFWWRMAANTRQPRAGAVSTTLRTRLREIYGRTLPGCVFYVSRNGRPFADGSFGHARRPGEPDGELAMTSSSIVHVGSVTKFFGAVAILRLVEDWNRIARALPSPNPGRFEQRVRAFGAPIDLDEPQVVPLLRPWLGRGFKPGVNVEDITLRQLLDHRSGLGRFNKEIPAANVAQAAGTTVEDLFSEPGDESPAHVNLRMFVTGFLKQDANYNVGYNNDGYAILTAILEVCTGSGYASWVRRNLFSDPRFLDLAPKVADPVRSARYYRFDGNDFQVGNHHPDYTDFSLTGGYYVSARALAEFVEALMSGAAVAGNRPILEQPELLFDRVGLNAYAIERFRGFDKNGAAAPGDGHTNARMAFLRGYGDERVFAFVEVNANVNADAALDRGLAAIAEPLSRRPPLELPTAGGSRLRQTAFWSEAGALRTAIRSVDVDLAWVTVGDVDAERTRLLGPGELAGGKSRDEVITVDLRGSLRSAGAGVYVFNLISDDGSFLWLNDALIADSGGDHGYRRCESDPVWLDADGWYPIRVRFYNATGGGNLWLEWRLPGASAFTAVPPDHFRTDM